MYEPKGNMEIKEENLQATELNFNKRNRNTLETYYIELESLEIRIFDVWPYRKIVSKHIALTSWETKEPPYFNRPYGEETYSFEQK